MESDNELLFKETFTLNLSITKANVGAHVLENQEARKQQNKVDAVVFRKEAWPLTDFYDRETDTFADEASKGPSMAFFREHPSVTILVACNHSNAPGLHKIRVSVVNSFLTAIDSPPTVASHELGNPSAWSVIALDLEKMRTELESAQTFGTVTLSIDSSSLSGRCPIAHIGLKFCKCSGESPKQWNCL